jgi:hypothetical protein
LETAKKIIFNILDLFAKNFFGIFLATLIVYKMKKPEEKLKKHYKQRHLNSSSSALIV